MLISDEYRRQNELIHKSDPSWGTTGHRYSNLVDQLFLKHGCKDALDYGCGKQTMKKAVSFKMSCYDPSIPELSKKPKPRDLVTCTDVMEHVEPECVDSVLDDLQNLTKKVLFVVISTVPAIKKLPDGRNAHITVRPLEWWLPKLCDRFLIDRVERTGPEFAALCRNKKNS